MAETQGWQEKPISDYWVQDSEIMQRLRLPEKVVRAALHVVDKEPLKYGFPPKEKLWGDRRYWPAVEKWFEREYALKMDAIRYKRAS